VSDEAKCQYRPVLRVEGARWAGRLAELCDAPAVVVGCIPAAGRYPSGARMLLCRRHIGVFKRLYKRDAAYVVPGTVRYP
jgi:hypothetical protein